jgi:hypothetical protein
VRHHEFLVNKFFVDTKSWSRKKRKEELFKWLQPYLTSWNKASVGSGVMATGMGSSATTYRDRTVRTWSSSAPTSPASSSGDSSSSLSTTPSTTSNGTDAACDGGGGGGLELSEWEARFNFHSAAIVNNKMKKKEEEVEEEDICGDQPDADYTRGASTGAATSPDNKSSMMMKVHPRLLSSAKVGGAVALSDRPRDVRFMHAYNEFVLLNQVCEVYVSATFFYISSFS